MSIDSFSECCMLGVPTYVTVAYGASVAGAPLILFVPPPARLAAHAALLCRVSLKLATAVVALAAVFVALGLWIPALTIGSVALLSLTLMFWANSEPRRSHRADEDDEGPDDGGGPKRSPDPGDHDGPGGLVIDWGEFDRARSGWHPQRSTVELADAGSR